MPPEHTKPYNVMQYRPVPRCHAMPRNGMQINLSLASPLTTKEKNPTTLTPMLLANDFAFFPILHHLYNAQRTTYISNTSV